MIALTPRLQYDGPYRVTSFSELGKTSNEDALRSLGEELALPEGWTYRTRIVDEDYVVVDQVGVSLAG